MKWATLLIITAIASLSGCNQNYKVMEVIDGDTIIVKPYMVVRIIGIDAPEVDSESQKQKDDILKYNSNSELESKLAFESKSELQRLLLNKTVTLKNSPNVEQEIQENGRAGRELRFVYISSTDVGKHMLEKGYARLWDKSFNPISYSHLKESEYSADETKAKDSGLGIWQKISTEKKE